ncbi:MAG TPA: Ig-like domain-containing protein [Gemmatimonadaceae bacterium]|nr:Ig-like domain-containing protein [Gemmatimonadaceae bacterium]
MAPTRLAALRALPLLAAVLFACDRAVAPDGVATVVVDPPAVTLWVGPAGAESVQLSATLRRADGTPLTGRPTAWTTGTPGVATVSADGLVTAVAEGQTTITVTSEEKQGTATVTVNATTTLPAGADIEIVDVQWTQGTQDESGSLPMVRGARPAVVNVLLTATQAIATPSQLVLRLTDNGGAEVHSDTANVIAPTGAAPHHEAPTAQFLVPAAVLHSANRWEVQRDPRRRLVDDSEENDVFPRDGPAELLAVNVPPLRIRFVPIVLTAHGNSTGNVSTSNVDEYLAVVRAVYPYGALDVQLGAQIATAATFGTGSVGGDAAFWQQVLTEVDVARTSNPANADAHWIGVVRPPPGFTFVTYGGFAYVPSSGTSVGPNTRSSVLVNVGWFHRESQTRELVAHEIGHNFGRLHAPCGSAGNPDPSFPSPAGVVGGGGHDVYRWSVGQAARAESIPRGTGDVLGYCSPVWSSAYTYAGVLAFRGTSGFLAARSVQAPTRVLVVRGTESDGRVSLEPSFVIEAVASQADGDGPYVLEGLADDGRVLFRLPFSPGTFDHAERARPIGVNVPLDAATEAALEALRVRGPAGDAVLVVPRAGSPGAAEPGRAAERSEPAGNVAVRCANASAQSILVQHDETGAFLGLGRGAELALPVQAGTPLRVLCSDGVRTRREVTRAP